MCSGRRRSRARRSTAAVGMDDAFCARGARGAARGRGAQRLDARAAEEAADALVRPAIRSPASGPSTWAAAGRSCWRTSAPATPPTTWRSWSPRRPGGRLLRRPGRGVRRAAGGPRRGTVALAGRPGPAARPGRRGRAVRARSRGGGGRGVRTGAAGRAGGAFRRVAVDLPPARGFSYRHPNAPVLRRPDPAVEEAQARPGGPGGARSGGRGARHRLLRRGDPLRGGHGDPGGPLRQAPGVPAGAARLPAGGPGR